MQRLCADCVSMIGNSLVRHLREECGVFGLYTPTSSFVASFKFTFAIRYCFPPPFYGFS